MSKKKKKKEHVLGEAKRFLPKAKMVVDIQVFFVFEI
jgi:hypothetical protein